MWLHIAIIIIYFIFFYQIHFFSIFKNFLLIDVIILSSKLKPSN